MNVGGCLKKYCSVSALRHWKRYMVMSVSSIEEPSVTERRWQSQEVLLSICTAALEKVHGHDYEQHQTRTSDPKKASIPRRCATRRSATHTSRQCWPEFRSLFNTNGDLDLAHPRHACVMRMITAMTQRNHTTRDSSGPDLIQVGVSGGHQVQKNVKVINQLDHLLMSVGDGNKRYCSVSASGAARGE